MKKGRLIWGILACALLAFAMTECDMGGSSTSALTACDAGADATCPAITPDPPPSGGW
jgi:hypothetical protein